ncbi:MAG: S41 family peptidase [Chitinophagaceae bacterium]
MKYAVIFTLLLFCSRTLTAQLDTTSNLTDTEKLFGLSLFWKEASYNFAYFDKSNINWDSAYQAFIPQVLKTKNTYEYYRVLEKFCALLKDGHTNVYPPFLSKGSTNTQMIFEYREDKVIVTNVIVQDSAKVPLGSEVISVNDMPIRDYLNTQVLPYVAASATHQLYNTAMRKMYAVPDTSHILNLQLKTPKGKMVAYSTRLTAGNQKWAYPYLSSKPGNFYYEELPGKIAYIQINTFGDTSVVSKFKQNLPAIYNAKGVIIDLRYNGGGNTDVGVDILKYFTDKKQLIGSAWRTPSHIASYKAWGYYIKDLKDTATMSAEEKEWFIKSYRIAHRDYWHSEAASIFVNDVTAPKIKAPLVVLMSNSTASAAEDFLIVLDGLKERVVTIGERSYGSTGQPLQLKLPGGGSARICTKRDTYPDGRDFVGYGVKPDIEVKRTLAGLLSGKDAVMEKALEVLKK